MATGEGAEPDYVSPDDLEEEIRNDGENGESSTFILMVLLPASIIRGNTVKLKSVIHVHDDGQVSPQQVM